MRRRRLSVVVEFATVPLGTASTSLSAYVAKACKVVEASGLPYTVTPMGTIIEAANLQEALEVVKQAHEALFAAGAKRVSTTIKIDDRRDKKRLMEDKVKALGGASVDHLPPDE